jgi:predicted nucleic acid-binding protein
MGVVLDSSVVIAAERARENPSDPIRRVIAATGNQELALTAIGYTELVHGVYRGASDIKRTLSQQFLDDLTRHLPVYPYTAETAELVGRIDAEQKSMGPAVPYIDLLIGGTALSLCFSILTANVRHFRLIPALIVIPF